MNNNSLCNEQEEFWGGEEGTLYIDRNKGDVLLSSNLYLFSQALKRAANINSCIEFGANIGMNLRALKLLYPAIQQRGIEINATAADELKNLIGEENVHTGSIHQYECSDLADLVLVKGVLIHINPNMLQKVYEKLYQSSLRYILICEYYNPSPVTVLYRGHNNLLFKRDFAGEMLDRYPDLSLLDYGFAYKRDRVFPQDDITWFLLGKE